MNERGCKVFHRALKNLGEREKNLSQSGDGVKELFKSNDSKVYLTIQVSCNCTFSMENRAPCHHILFLRKDDDNVLMFDKDLFDIRYLRNELVETHAHVVVNRNEYFPEFQSNEVTVNDLSLTDREKY